jgi:hypothetical protein
VGTVIDAAGAGVAGVSAKQSMVVNAVREAQTKRERSIGCKYLDENYRKEVSMIAV